MVGSFVKSKQQIFFHSLLLLLHISWDLVAQFGFWLCLSFICWVFSCFVSNNWTVNKNYKHQTSFAECVCARMWLVCWSRFMLIFFFSFSLFSPSLPFLKHYRTHAVINILYTICAQIKIRLINFIHYYDFLVCFIISLFVCLFVFYDIFLNKIYGLCFKFFSFPYLRFNLQILFSFTIQVKSVDKKKRYNLGIERKKRCNQKFKKTQLIKELKLNVRKNHDELEEDRYIYLLKSLEKLLNLVRKYHTHYTQFVCFLSLKSDGSDLIQFYNKVCLIFFYTRIVKLALTPETA